MEINLNDWDELASYYNNPTPPGMIYEDGKLLGFGLSNEFYLDKYGDWHCKGDWKLYLEVINLMQAMTDEKRTAFKQLGDSLKEACLINKEVELAREMANTCGDRMEISDDGDLSIRMSDDHTGWIVDESTDPECHGYLSKRALQLMLEMLEDE